MQTSTYALGSDTAPVDQRAPHDTSSFRLPSLSMPQLRGNWIYFNDQDRAGHFPGPKQACMYPSLHCYPVLLQGLLHHQDPYIHGMFGSYYPVPLPQPALVPSQFPVSPLSPGSADETGVTADSEYGDVTALENRLSFGEPFCGPASPSESQGTVSLKDLEEIEPAKHGGPEADRPISWDSESLSTPYDGLQIHSDDDEGQYAAFTTSDTGEYGTDDDETAGSAEHALPVSHRVSPGPEPDKIEHNSSQDMAQDELDPDIVGLSDESDFASCEDSEWDERSHTATQHRRKPKRRRTTTKKTTKAAKEPLPAVSNLTSVAKKGKPLDPYVIKGKPFQLQSLQERDLGLSAVRRVDVISKHPVMLNKCKAIIRGLQTCGPDCPVQFRTLLEMAAHLDKEHDAFYRRHICPEADCPWSVLGFHKRPECVRHARAQHCEQRYVCPIEECRRGFVRLDSYRRHHELSHVNPDSRFNLPQKKKNGAGRPANSKKRRRRKPKSL